MSLAKLRPFVFLGTEGDNNTRPNPPLLALLTQSIPHGGELNVAKLSLPNCGCPGNVNYGFAVMSARCGAAVWTTTGPTLVGDNELDSAVMAMTLSVYERRSAMGDYPISLECVGEAVGGRIGASPSNSPLLFKLFCHIKAIRHQCCLFRFCVTDQHKVIHL